MREGGGGITNTKIMSLHSHLFEYKHTNVSGHLMDDVVVFQNNELFSMISVEF